MSTAPSPRSIAVVCVLQGFLSLGFQFLFIKHLAPAFGNSILTWALVTSGAILSYVCGSLLGSSVRVTPRIVSLTLLVGLGLYVVSGSIGMLYLSGAPYYVGLVITTVVYCSIPLLGYSLLLPTLFRELSVTGIAVTRYFGLAGLGSLLGAIIPTFALLPNCPLSMLRFLWLLVTVLLVLLWARCLGRQVLPGFSWAPLFLLAGLDPLFQPQMPHQIYDQATPFGWLAVTKEKEVTTLFQYYNHSISAQTIWDKTKPGTAQGVFQPVYSRWKSQSPQQVLQLGLGGASVNRAVASLTPRPTLTTIEISPTMLYIARKYFGWQESAHDKVLLGDARRITRTLPDSQYDCIIVDAFFGDNAPEHLRTVEFYRLLARKLAPNGYVAVNLPTYYQVFEWDQRTLASVFPDYTYYPLSDKQTVFVGRPGIGSGPKGPLLSDDFNPSPFLSLLRL